MKKVSKEIVKETTKPMSQDRKDDDYRSIIIAIIRGLKFTISLLEKVLRGEKI